MMIDAVMYGMIPRKNTETAVSAPPENRSNKPRTPPLLSFRPCVLSDWIDLKSTYGTGMCEPTRNKKTMNSVKKILFRRSGTRNMFWRRRSPAITGCYLPVHVRVSARRRAAGRPRQRELLDGPTRRLDRAHRSRGEAVGANCQGLGQLAPGQDFYQSSLGNEASLAQRVGGDFGARVEIFERREVHDV